MGNKISCSCAPLIKKAYKYEDSPWQVTRRRDGHLLRLWAEVFHVSSTGVGTVKWLQVSEDLVPVNITCIQDHPDFIFHITAYNSQVEKILDVKLVQPGTRLGQASECFVYWKDPSTGDTWGLNFTSPGDAKQFRECCSPSFKFSRKASSSYSLKLEPPSNKQKTKTKRKPMSTPASPSRAREPQCTCMTAEQYARLRAQDPRYRAFQTRSATLPRFQSKSADFSGSREKVSAAPSSNSVYDNVGGSSSLKRTTEGFAAGRSASARVASTAQSQQPQPQQPSQTAAKPTPREPAQAQQKPNQQQSPQQQSSQQQSSQTQSPPLQLTSQQSQTLPPREQRDRATQQGPPQIQVNDAPKYERQYRPRRDFHNTKSVDYSDMDTVREDGRLGRRYKSKSTNDMTLGGLSLDSNTLKRMLKPMTSFESPVTSPETSRRHPGPSRYDGYISEPEIRPSKFNRLGHDLGISRFDPFRPFLDYELRNGDISPPSDSVMFDNQCYATTPSSSNGNSDLEHGAPAHGGASPTTRLLQEYERHLRNTLAKGMDAESYSLHTFEALLTQSMENLESILNPRELGLGLHRGSQRFSLNASDAEKARPAENGLISGFRQQQRANLLNEVNKIHQRYQRVPEGLRDGCLPQLNRSCTLPVGSRLPERQYSLGRLEGVGSRSGYLTPSRHEGGFSRSFYPERSYSSEHPSRMSFYDHQDSIRSGYLSDRETSRGYASDRERGYFSDHSTSFAQQASVESADSRLCYLTSSEISDDDRLSLTTAVSDDEDGESVHNSPYKGNKSGSAAASFNCTGAVRKAGFLSVKKWLLRKKHQVELAKRRGWKGYWVCLKGTTLLFYPCDSHDGQSIEAAPKHLIIVDGAIMQPIPEHPKREYIFCLSTAFGDAYLFQAPCQVELENWVNSIHCACAAAFARHRGKTGTLHLLQEEIFRLERAIETDSKLKHMAELQMSVVSDVDSKQQITSQVTHWEENLERLHCEQFRLRCYMASLQNGELPNPKGLLTHVSRSTKIILNRLGVFTVSSFHAYICARSPSLLNNLLAGRGATKRRAPMLSRSNSASSRRSLNVGSSGGGDPSKSYTVNVPENQTSTVYLKDAMTVEEFLVSACNKKSLNALEHFVRVKKRRDMEDSNYFVPHRSDLIESYIHTHEVVEICAKILYQVELSRAFLEQLWGFSVEAELIENTERQDELCCYISRVEDKSFAMQSGLIKGDEIMVINGAIVSDLDMMYIESVLQEELSLCLMLRSSRTEPPEHSDDMIDSLVCPPPPRGNHISDEMISGLIVPAPSWKLPNSSVHIPVHQSSRRKLGSALSIDKGYPLPEITGCPPPPPCSLVTTTNRSSSFEIENLLKTAEQVTGFCRSPTDPQKEGGSPTGSIASSQGIPGRVLTEGEKLRKVILELVDTETTYVKHLNNLREVYLEPLKKETFLSQAEINALFGNIQELVAFQKSFLHSLEEALEMEPEFTKFEEPAQFKNILFSLGNAFLYHANHFKLYSSFCASHSKAQKILHPSEGSRALQDFLNSRNPKQQHSCTLESYLIKPIQRILKYPLLLQQLKSLTDVNSDQHRHLSEALKGMEKVAEHINEMQRIHEEYGAIFDHLFRQHQKSCKQPVDLSPGDLLYYGGVEWLNISDFLGKIKKGLELHAMCFVFKTAVVFLCKERLRQKKKLMGNSSKTNAAEVEIIRYQVLIPVTEVQVRASNMKDMDSHFLWELIHLKSQVHRRNEKVYHLSNSTSVFRNAFLRTIRQIIRESVRNMSIPSNRPLPPPAQASKTLTRKKSSRGSKPSSCQDYDNLEAPDSGRRERSKTVTEGVDTGDQNEDYGGREMYEARSEGEEDECRKPTLGRTPNHLSLSTTSTLSAGSTSSQAKLIHASNQPTSFQPNSSHPLGSPIWKPRDDEPSAFPLVTKSGRSTPAGGPSSERKGEELTGTVYLTPPASKKESQTMTIDRLIYQLKALS